MFKDCLFNYKYLYGCENVQTSNEISFLSAYGPNTAPDKWLLTPFGRKIIYDEIKKVSWAALEEQQKEWRLQ